MAENVLLALIEIIGSDEGGIEAKTVLQQITVPANTSNLPVAAVIEVGDNISVQDRVIPTAGAPRLPSAH